MTREHKFALCMEAAARIVSAYRSEAPEGCDPKNTWVAIGVGVAGTAVSAGTSMYSANQSKKANQKMVDAMGKPMPAFQPINFGSLNKDAIATDQNAYRLSDKDFATRHPQLLDAEHRFETQTDKDQMGNTELMPALQNEFMKAGIAGSLGSFGDAGNTLAPGSAGEASVARNLGQSILGFEQLNRGNRQQSLTLADQLFPRRQFGLTGTNEAQVEMQNAGGQNNWNQANYAHGIQGAQLENSASQQNIAQNAAIMASLTSSLTKSAGQYVGATGTSTANGANGLQGNGFYNSAGAAQSAYGGGDANVINYAGKGYSLG